MKQYYEEVEKSVNELSGWLSTKFSEDDIQRVRSAYEFAKKAHNAQKRKSGVPYITHPVAVARIVAEELELGIEPIMAALLHDVVEDTKYKIEDIEEHFGKDVAFLVGVLTKKKKKTKGTSSKQVDNFKQILASLNYDIRALLIKLADRLHNMRTLESMRSDKQMKIAGETDYFYAPLANRLGLHPIKTELENLSFKYRSPKEYENLENNLAQDKETKAEQIQHFIGRVHEALAVAGLEARTELRWRKPHSVMRRMHETGREFHHVPGKHYLRIIYPDNLPISEKRNSLRIYSALTDYFKEQPGSVANYIDSPKANGNQSFHINLLSDHGTWEEVHISSERMVKNARLGCVAEQTEGNINRWLNKFKFILEDAAYHSQEIDFMDGVTMSFYNEDIQVYTPRGMRIILPKGATALDFAYELHTEIGKTAKYARINGRLCPVTTELATGDCVEIGTDEKVQMFPEWHGTVVTYKAKKHIGSYFSKKPKLKYILCDECMPIPGEEVVGFKDEEGSVTVHKRNCPAAIRSSSRHGDSIVDVDFTADEEFLFPVSIEFRGVDRYHLLSDLVACITDQLHLYMTKLFTETNDYIATCHIDLLVHSADELKAAMENISKLEGVDEVLRKKYV